MNQLPGGASQISTVLKQLRPEILGGGSQWQRTKSVANLPQQLWQVGLELAPVRLDGRPPMLHVPTLSLPAETGRYRRGVDCPIWLEQSLASS